MTSVSSVMNSVTPVSWFRSNRILSVQPKHTTRCHRLHNRKNILTLIHLYLMIQLHSMNLVLYKHHIFINALCCDSRIYPFLEIDVKGGERDHIKAYHFRESITFSGGERSFRERERDPQGEIILVESISQGS